MFLTHFLQTENERISLHTKIIQPRLYMTPLDISWVDLHSQFIRDCFQDNDVNPDSKVHGANMGPTWVLSAPDGPHVGPINLAIREQWRSNFGQTGCRPWLKYWVIDFSSVISDVNVKH